MTRQREKKLCEKRQWDQNVLTLSVASTHQAVATSNCRIRDADVILINCEPCLTRLNVATAGEMLKFALRYQYECQLTVKNGTDKLKK